MRTGRVAPFLLRRRSVTQSTAADFTFVFRSTIYFTSNRNCVRWWKMCLSDISKKPKKRKHNMRSHPLHTSAQPYAVVRLTAHRAPTHRPRTRSKAHESRNCTRADARRHRTRSNETTQLHNTYCQHTQSTRYYWRLAANVTVQPTLYRVLNTAHHPRPIRQARLARSPHKHKTHSLPSILTSLTPCSLLQ